MKNLIYQVWAGELRPGCNYSSKLMKEYADRIGADYRLDIDPNIASKTVDANGMYWEWLNPMLDDSFLEYDKVCVVDLDVFPVDGLEQNIFDEEIDLFGVCTEPFQGKYRASTVIGGSICRDNDEKWAEVCWKAYGQKHPRDKDGFLKVYNAGMVVFTQEGMQLARDKWMKFQAYTNIMRSHNFGRFYTVDQNYFHAMIVAGGHYTEMHNGWNNYIHYTRGPLGLADPIHDSRNDETKFVHIQLSGADYFDDDKIYNITNKSRAFWKLDEA